MKTIKHLVCSALFKTYPATKKQEGQYKILERIKNGHLDEFKQEYLNYVSTNLDSIKDKFIKLVKEGMEFVEEHK